MSKGKFVSYRNDDAGIMVTIDVEKLDAMWVVSAAEGKGFLKARFRVAHAGESTESELAFAQYSDIVDAVNDLQEQIDKLA